jgi:hypothetical protein
VTGSGAGSGLSIGPRRCGACFEDEIWPQIRPDLLGKGISKAEQEKILGYGPEGV